ncbi:MAG: hypothetical protein ABSD77_05695 [Verrucomicrobiota bacterium]|jgi:hypothetical protein
MYQKHSVTKLPANLDSPIWRYINLIKFLDLLRTSELYFARADTLNDPFEGSWPLGGIKRRQAHYVDSEKTFEWLSRGFLSGSYLNCWHISEYESAAMWNLYLGASQGVAIRSTCNRLIDALRLSIEDVYIAEVRYIDYRTDDFAQELQDNSLTPIVYKRRSFEHEKELRAIICRAFAQNRPEDGVRVIVDLPKLVEGVYVSPNAPSWFRPIVKDIVFRFNQKFPVHQSELATDPVY